MRLGLFTSPKVPLVKTDPNPDTAQRSPSALPNTVPRDIHNSFAPVFRLTTSLQGYSPNFTFLPASSPLSWYSSLTTPAMASKDHRSGIPLPIPPPPLHTRSSNDGYGRPRTPTQDVFISPQQTPQGSPSKHHQPPGAFDLPNVFENAMRLLPTMGSPSKLGRHGQSPGSPNKSNNGAEEGNYLGQDTTTITTGSPTRKANKENTPPSGRPGLQKETSYTTHAATARQEPYKSRDTERQTHVAHQRLSPEELEKARKPAVKRLANVTQLCK